MNEQTFDLVVIGAGPGGYVAAIRAAQLGMHVACVERSTPGGTCLNVGCIPSKALLDSTERFYQLKTLLPREGIHVENARVDLAAMMARKEGVVRTLVGGVQGLLRKHHVELVGGQAKIISPTKIDVASGGGATRRLRTRRILIATGSAPIELPSLPFDGVRVISSTEALSLATIPKKLLIVGAGVIGLELGSIWSRLGTQVLILEYLDRCVPGVDLEMATALQKSLQKQGIHFRFRTTATAANISGESVRVSWKSGEQTGEEEADHVLVAVGRRPVTDGLGLAEVGVKLDAKGFVVVDDYYATSVPGIWAIGDVIGGLMLAHKAQEEAVAVAEMMATRGGMVNYRAMPNVVYTHPELASVGLSEEQATAAGIHYKVGRFPFSASGRARCLGETEGLVKVLADARTDRLLGVHILAPRGSDLIAEAVVAVEFAGSAEDLARSIHAHPTLPEAIKEAALAVSGEAVHI